MISCPRPIHLHDTLPLSPSVYMIPCPWTMCLNDTLPLGPSVSIISVICTISHINDPHHLITFTATLLSSPPSSALITILPFTSPPLRPLCIHSAFINTIIHLRSFFNRPPIIYVVLSFQA